MPKKAAKKAGRPKLATGKKRVFSSWIPISPEERRLFQAAAEKAGKALATWARDILLAAAEH